MARRAHACTNCGAALDIPTEHARYFTCSFCGSVLEDTTPPGQRRGELQIRVAQVDLDPSQLAAYAAPAAKAAGVITLVMTVVVLAVVAGVVFTILRAVDDATTAGSGSVRTAGGDSATFFNYAAAAVIPSDDATGRDVVAFARGNGGDTIAYLDLDADTPLRWNVDIGVDSDTFTRFVATDDLVILTVGAEVLALNRQSGAEAWRAALSDTHAPNLCTDCLRLFGETVVVLTQDGVLSARPVATGEQTWSVTLTEVPRQVVDFGGNPAVLDSVDGDAQLHVFGLADGQVVRRLPLGCPDTTFGGRNAVNVFQLLVDAGAGVAFVGDSAFTPCMQRWDPPGDAPSVEVPYEISDFAGLDADGLVATDAALYVGGGDRADRIGFDGRVTPLLTVPDAEVFPVATDDAVAVLLVASSRGSGSHQLQAVDVATGNVKWTFDLESTDRHRPGEPGIMTGDSWAAELTSGGLSVIQFREEAEELVVQIIPLASGTASPPATLDLGRFGATVFPTPLGWFDDDLFLLVDAAVLRIDGATGKIEQQGP